MKRLLYLTIKDFSGGNSDGVVKKITNHISAFVDAGFLVDYTYTDARDKSVHFVCDGQDEIIGNYSILGGVFCKVIVYKYLCKKLQETKYDGTYIRFLGGRTDPWHLDILRVLKKHGVKIVLEITTYPYDDEGSKFETFIDKCFRGSLKKYVDRILTFSVDESIFGIKTIRTMNGIRVDNINPINASDKHDDALNMIAVASFEVGHGYERVISGLGEYYKSGGGKNIVIHMVGDGTDKSLYMQLAKDNGLNDHVIFYGKKHGEELNKIYDKADIALGTFGWYKKKNYFLSSLKSREYLSKGLPVVTGVVEDVLQNHKYGLMFPNDPTPVDIAKILEWYDSLLSEYEKKDSLVKEIRTFAKNTVDVSVVMAPVVKYFNEEKENI